MRQVSNRIRMLRGTGVKTDRADRDQHVARPPITLPRCPRELSPEAKREFRRVGAMLVRLGLVSEIDHAVLAGYASSFALWCRAGRELQADGRLLVPGPNGVLYANPLIRIAETAATSMRRFAVEMGLSAASRTRTPAVPVVALTPESNAAELKFFGPGR
jgi:P27 family predicted phage terminase small subunit